MFYYRIICKKCGVHNWLKLASAVRLQPGIYRPCDGCGHEEQVTEAHYVEQTPIDRALEAHADMVNHPPHYADGKVECIDALEAATKDLTGLDAVCTANAIKYLWRWKKKNGHEDLRKARWYINKILGDTP